MKPAEWNRQCSKCESYDIKPNHEAEEYKCNHCGLRFNKNGRPILCKDCKRYGKCKKSPGGYNPACADISTK